MNCRTELPDKEHCTGCQACRLACPVKAISMLENEHGHIYPFINEDICICCNKCAKTCPEFTPVNLCSDKQVYALWTNDSSIRKYSTSGGASYILSRKIVERQGYFCGVEYKDNEAIHTICNDVASLHRYQGSKYMHSDVKNVYAEIENLLKEGKTVLFTGTPCQVAGLRSYLRKEYENLYCIDLVCHGVPSRRIKRDRIEYIEKANNKKVVDLRFREKKPDQHNTHTKYTFSDGSSISQSVYYDEMFRCFVSNHALRDNCFNCRYATGERCGDITISDFWGYVPAHIRYISYQKGTSMVLVNNSKGKYLLNLIKDECTIDDQRTFQEAAECNRNLYSPQPKPEKYDEFWSEYLSGKSIEELAPEYYPVKVYKTPFKRKVKLTIKLLLPKSIIKLIK